ncbi:helix-turn-helix domain-containing protein, partial [Salmonella enterica subsp. enterica serovar Anatum]|nr:helix-turn-helix domain-containing protein [Salmonella enterica subsp. enterica serovar Anatum]
AKLLLSTTRMPIATVGRNVGFDDQLYFSRVFKKCTGASPSEFMLGRHHIVPNAVQTQMLTSHVRAMAHRSITGEPLPEVDASLF